MKGRLKYKRQMLDTKVAKTGNDLCYMCNGTGYFTWPSIKEKHYNGKTHVQKCSCGVFSTTLMQGGLRGEFRSQNGNLKVFNKD